MGTCYLRNGYQSIQDLVEEYGLKGEQAPEETCSFWVTAHHGTEINFFLILSRMELVTKSSMDCERHAGNLWGGRVHNAFPASCGEP